MFITLTCNKVEAYTKQDGSEGSLATLNHKNGLAFLLFEEMLKESKFVVGRNYIVSLIEEGATNGN